MTEASDNSYPYIGSTEADGTIRVEGPLSPEALKKRQQEIFAAGKASTTTSAASKSQAVLKIVIGVINHDKSKAKP